jgi:hypothetical protein
MKRQIWFGLMMAGAGVATGVLIQYLRGQPLMVPLLVIALLVMVAGYVGSRRRLRKQQ